MFTSIQFSGETMPPAISYVDMLESPPSATSLPFPTRQTTITLFGRLPRELLPQIFSQLNLVIDQMRFAQALPPEVELGYVMSLLIDVMPDQLFKHEQFVRFMFGPNGIRGHNAVRPPLRAVFHPKYNPNGNVKDLYAVVRAADKARDRNEYTRLRKSLVDLQIHYRRRAATQSRRKRQGKQPIRAYKSALKFLEKDDKRSYRELRIAFACQKNKYKAIKDAEAADDTQGLTVGKNYEVLDKLCNALFTNTPEFECICRGCPHEIGFYSRKLDPLPFCSACFAKNCVNTRIGKLDTFTFYIDN